jgi:A/G-specific adenine glycosylase
VAHGGRLPDTEAALRELPGIGPYTAAAIAAIAFDRRASVVDGNVERVIVRLHGLAAPIRAIKPEIRRLAELRTPNARCGDYAQAMMDLGATICTPRRPACVICPLSKGCIARETGRQDVLPVKAAKPERPERRGSVFYVRSGGHLVLVRTRPDRGLLGGMTEFPGSAWNETGDSQGSARPLPARYLQTMTPVVHGFTHFSLTLDVHVAEVPMGTAAPSGCRWVEENALPQEALPSLMRKVAAAAQTRLGPCASNDATRGAA